MSIPSKAMLQGVAFLAFALWWIASPSLSHAQAVNLEALGIDASFELPDLGGNDAGEQVNQVGFGPGWSFNQVAGELSDWGVQDPGPDFFARVADTPDNDDLAGPLDGRQIGFVNLNSATASGEVVSLSVGKLLASTNYTLTVAVGIRQNQAAWTADYDIGLRTLDGTDLGTFASVNKTNLSLPEDLVYNLNIGAAHPNIGDEVSIVIRSTNAAGDAFSQSAFDNVRLAGTFGAANTPLLTINRSTGGMTLSKTGTDNFSVLGYRIMSDAGALNASSWTKIGGTWSEVSNSADELAEAELSGSAATTLSSGSPKALGSPWRRTPFEDVEAEILLSNGSTMPVVVQYTGTEIPFGDLTGDGAINTADWTAFKGGQGQDFTGLLPAQAYLMGDLDNNLAHTLSDFALFRTAYDTANGVGAFAAMVASIPEPGSLALVSCGLLAVVASRRRRLESGRTTCSAEARSVSHNIRFRSRFLLTLGLVAAFLFLGTRQSLAQTIGPIQVPNFSFEDPDRAGDGNANDEDAYDVANGNEVPTGWTIDSTVNQNYGQQRPDPDAHFTRDVTGGETSPFTLGGFDGDLILFGNLNSVGATLTADSSILGQLQQGSYTLTVALGARNTGSWNDLDYTIGLVGSTSGALGTATAVTLNPGNADLNSTAPTNSPWTVNAYNVVDVTYSLNVPNGSALIGEDYFVRITAANSGFHDGVEDTDFTQAAIDNVRVVGPSIPQFGLYVDPASGQMQIRNPTGSDVAISSYEIKSSSETLNSAGWSSIESQSMTAFPAGNGTGNGWEAGANPSNGELAEYFLQGQSTLSAGSFVDLGASYDAAEDGQDVKFNYTKEDGTVVAGLVYYQTIIAGDFDFDQDVDENDLTTWQEDYGAFRDGRDYLTWQRNLGTSPALATASVVPEPAGWFLIANFMSFLIFSRPKNPQGVAMKLRTAPAWISSLSIAVLLFASQVSFAAVTVDREYLFGDDSGEGANAGNLVGSGNGNGTSYDSSSVAGFRDLAVNGSPTYVDVGPGGLARPGAGAGDLGVNLDGSSYLLALRFNDPETAPGTPLGNPSGGQDYSGITNRGFQLWVYPAASSLEEANEHIVVHDTSEHGLRIDNGDNSWIMMYDGGNHDSGVGLSGGGDTWYHVMVIRPNGGQNNIGGSLLYVNGVAIEGEPGPYDVTPAPAGEADYFMTIGTDTGNGQSDLIDADSNRFTGVVDDLTFFTFGTTLNGTNLGTYNFAEDNAWAATHLTGVAGDVDQNGVLDPVADVNALIAGWGMENRVDGILAGDMTTILDGDLNFDGQTNLADAFALNQALVAAGFAAFDFSQLQAVPEPTTAVLAGVFCMGVLSCRRRRTESPA